MLASEELRKVQCAQIHQARSDLESSEDPGVLPIPIPLDVEPATLLPNTALRDEGPAEDVAEINSSTVAQCSERAHSAAF
jgi:hypothetical protein